MEIAFSVLVNSVLRQQAGGCYDHEIRKCSNSKLKNQHHHLTRSGKSPAPKRGGGGLPFSTGGPIRTFLALQSGQDLKRGVSNLLICLKMFYVIQLSFLFTLLMKFEVQTGMSSWKKKNKVFIQRINFANPKLATAKSRSEDTSSGSISVTFSFGH